ncbi:PQQ-binding-like beta-propeller repeat protein [Ochrovirga pacifica]|uniref:PQQ-binding-like beta-propeller repeat protein n=1 Tax=Ochrovirga pacifica TaxID=1042376 RepID=UPI000255836F|nr:PQQ-binding-like beta-propeller repeat protein [Ochrovirga pacifica]
MKLFKKITTGMLIGLMLISYQSRAQTSVIVANSENQWPMSGGPHGNWKVQTNNRVPTHWSVRTGKNIKWKTTLPEGGQSGIAVWNDKLFLTINPPNKNPEHKILLKAYQQIKKTYNKKFKAEVNALEMNQNKDFLLLQKNYKIGHTKWQQVLKNNAYYQHGSVLERPEIERNMMRKDKVGKEYAKVLESYRGFVHKKNESLRELFAELELARKKKNGGASSKDIVLLCLNSETGKILWQKTVKGTIESQYNYGFSDATTPCPATDGTHVWAINASGGMACFTIDGIRVWERTWQPTIGRPFNKQFDSVLFQNLILNVEPPVSVDILRQKDWNYLHAFDKLTGKRIWVTQQALTHYNTPILGETAEGIPAILMGRGGPHEVPERPVGLSLISLAKENQGIEIWNWQPKEPNTLSGWGALSTQHWNSGKASWFDKGNHHTIIDANTGKFIAKKQLNIVNQYNFDTVKQSYVLAENVKLKGLQNQRHCNFFTENNVYYMVRYSPYLAKHNTITGENEHLEVPRNTDAKGNYLYGIPQNNDGLNSQGQLNAADPRTRGNGFQKCFLGSPTKINNYIYFTNAVGMVYVVNANAKKFDESALVAVNDLGQSGKTWTVNSLSYANGKIYHRTMKEVICIE